MSLVGRQRARPTLRLLVVVSLAVAAALWGAPAAQAHAYLVGSNPTDGAVLDVAPSTLSLDFSESVVLPATTFALTGDDGASHPVGAARVVGSPGTTDREDPVQVTAQLAPLPRGAYRLTWRTLSADDLHATSGVIVFGVGTAVEASGWSETTPSPFEALLRAIILAAVAVGVAAPVAARVWRRGAAPGDEATTVLGPTGALVGVAGAVAGLLLLASQLLGSSQAVDSILESRYAVWWSLREVGLVLLVLGSFWTGSIASGRSHRSAGSPGSLGLRSSRALAVSGALVAAVATSLLGHSATGPSGSVLRALVSVTHVLSTACWLGTLALLLLVVVRRRPPAARVRSVLVAFGPVAGVSVALMGATGLALASDVVGSLDALLLTTYGRLLVAKVVLVAALLVAGLVTHRRLRRPRGDAGPRPLGRLVVAEVAGGIVVLLLTGLVTTGQPALERALTADPRVPGSVSTSQQVGDLQEEVAVRPNLPGQNVAVVRVADSRRPSPGPVTAVTVVVVDSAGKTTTAAATRAADGVWSAPLSLQEWGPVTLRTVVERPRLPAVTGEVAWSVTAPAGTPGPTVSRAPLAPVLTAAAWAVLALLVIGTVVALRRRPTARPPRPRGSGPLTTRSDHRGPAQGSGSTSAPVPVGAAHRDP